MRTTILRLTAPTIALLLAFGLVQAKPDKDKVEQKKTDTPAFKPIEINNELANTDGNDPKLEKPAKKFTVKLQKDKTYIIDLIAVNKDFDPYLRLLDAKGNELAEDDDGGGDLNSLLIFGATETADHQVVAATLDGQLGKFKLKVREFALKGEAKARDLGKDGFSVTANINQNDKTDINKLGKVYSINLKAGQTYTIDLASGTMDSYLYLFDGKSKLLAQDDDSGGDLNSRIIHRADKDGVFHIIATSLGGDETGEFTLKVSKSD
jgi:hypothetical protein